MPAKRTKRQKRNKPYTPKRRTPPPAPLPPRSRLPAPATHSSTPPSSTLSPSSARTIVSPSPTISASTSSPSPSTTQPPKAPRFGNSFFLGEHEGDPKWWHKPLRRPDTFPRDDWTSAVWVPPNMSSTTLFVVGSLFQWAGKFASVAVAEALEGKVAWDEVGDHGVHLAIVDLMLQCRDYLRIKKSADYLRTLNFKVNAISADVWLKRLTAEWERIFALALTKIPADIGARINRDESLRMCLSAAVTNYGGLQDCSTCPPVVQHVWVPISFLRQYDTTHDQLARYGVMVIRGRVQLDMSEDELLRAAVAHEKKYGPTKYVCNPLLGRGLDKPVPMPSGPVPSGWPDTYYVAMPHQRGKPVNKK